MFLIGFANCLFKLLGYSLLWSRVNIDNKLVFLKDKFSFAFWSSRLGYRLWEILFCIQSLNIWNFNSFTFSWDLTAWIIFILNLQVRRWADWSSTISTAISWHYKHVGISTLLSQMHLDCAFHVGFQIFNWADLAICVLNNIRVFCCSHLFGQVLQQCFHVFLNLVKETHIPFKFWLQFERFLFFSQQWCSFFIRPFNLLL